MIRRLIAALVALLLAGVGAGLLLGYVSAADRRAMAGMETVRVLVVTEQVAEGTPVTELASLVTSKTLPVVAVPAGALSSLEPVRDLVTTTSLAPGEPLLNSRFADPASLLPPDTVAVPKGMQELTLALEPHRVVGGELQAGATVGVFVSLPEEGERPAQTKLVLHKVLVSKIRGAASAAAPESDSDDAPEPVTSVAVTLAMTTPEAEKVVYGAEHGKIWLSLEPAEATTTGSRIVTDQGVYR